MDADTHEHEEEADEALEALNEEVPEELHLVDPQAEQLLHRPLLALAHPGAGEEVSAQEDGEPGDDLAVDVFHGGWTVAVAPTGCKPGPGGAGASLPG